MEKKVSDLFKPVKAIVLDVDGVLTDGSLMLLPDGDQVRTMNIRDGYAMQFAVKAGYHLTIISAGNPSRGVDARLRKLGIHDFRLGVTDKMEAFEDFVHSYHLSYDQVLYMGDDMPDYDCMIKAGVAACPADAANEIKRIAHYTSPVAGGKGCVREVIEKVLTAQGTHWAENL